MSKKKPTPGGRAKKKAAVSLVRSSAAEYLTFVAAGGDSEASVEMRYEDENIWLTQKMMAALYDVSIPAINQHLKRIFSDNELEESSVVKQYLITAADAKNYQTKHYSLQAIIAVGYKVNSERAVQFRKWATGIIEADLVDCIVALPGHLFYSTQIPVCLWFCGKNNTLDSANDARLLNGEMELSLVA